MNTKDFDQHQKIIALMCQRPAIWYLPKDFMQGNLGDLFVGYEASARLSELAKNYPQLIESQKDGRFLARRIRMDNIDHALLALPPKLKAIVEHYFLPRTLF